MNEIIYTLPEIAEKLSRGELLNEIERQMAAGTIRLWLKETEARMRGGAKSKGGGRPPKPDADPKRRERYLRSKEKKVE